MNNYHISLDVISNSWWHEALPEWMMGWLDFRIYCVGWAGQRDEIWFDLWVFISSVAFYNCLLVPVWSEAHCPLQCCVCSCGCLFKPPTNVLFGYSCFFQGVVADHVVNLEPELLRNGTDPFMKGPHLIKSCQGWWDPVFPSTPHWACQHRSERVNPSRRPGNAQICKLGATLIFLAVVCWHKYRSFC